MIGSLIVWGAFRKIECICLYWVVTIIPCLLFVNLHQLGITISSPYSVYRRCTPYYTLYSVLKGLPPTYTSNTNTIHQEHR